MGLRLVKEDCKGKTRGIFYSSDGVNWFEDRNLTIPANVEYDGVHLGPIEVFWIVALVLVFAGNIFYWVIIR